jgi:DNA invertase Pin-like site-specific DNA recombinase
VSRAARVYAAPRIDKAPAAHTRSGAGHQELALMPTAESKPAVLYAARSTEDEHGTIPTQLADCRKMAAREGWEIVHEDSDEGFSAFKGNRGPGLERAKQAAVDAATEHGDAVLVVQHSDRVARGSGDAPDAPDHLGEVVGWLTRRRVTLRCVQDDLYGDPRVAPLMAAVMGQRNTEDSLRKSEAVKSGKRRAFERGELPGGPNPDGLERISKRDYRLTERIDIIRLIGDLADEGWGDPSIHREMNRRGHRTKGGKAWTRRRIQDTLTNPTYYGGIPWQRGTPDQEINWTGHTAPWTREDYERRAKARAGRDRAMGSNRNPRGRTHSNHALAGLAVCGRCVQEGEEIQYMRPITSTYRRKDGSRRRTYVCRHVHGSTGLCDMPPIDAEQIDTHVVNELRNYLGDFEAWQEQLLSGYANERERLAREIEAARKDFAEQEQITERTERAIGLAEDERQAKAAMRAASSAQQELERRQTRLDAAQGALDEVPTEAPADSMLDFYNELGAAVRGRLDGADTIARVNDALRDIFQCFVLDPPPHPFGDGICVMPVLGVGHQGWTWEDMESEFGPTVTEDDEEITPPLRTFRAPSAEMANTHE